MLAVLITLTPGRRDECIHCHKGKERIALLPIMDVKTPCDWTLELLEQVHLLQRFTSTWLNNSKYSDYGPLFTTHDSWTILKYAMEVLSQFQYWMLWMSKRHTVTLHHVISVCLEMFDHMYGVMGGLARKKTQWKEDLYFAVKCPRQKFFKYYTELTSIIDMHLISAQTVDSFKKKRSFGKWDMWINIHPEDETSYTTQ